MVSIRSYLLLLFLTVSVALPLRACTQNSDVLKTNDGPRYATEFRVVELAADASVPLQLAVHACAGLYNRRLGGSLYIQKDTRDSQWLEDLDLKAKSSLAAPAFLDECVHEFPACVRYSYATQHELMPPILTAAAALDAVPLDASLSVECGTVKLDATKELANKTTPYLATHYVYEHFIEQTTGLAMLDPGYDQNAEDLGHPELIHEMSSALVDFVFSQKLFALFLVNGCVEGNPEKDLLSAIVNNGRWPSPLGVYGYNSSWLAGGYIYEAQTRCLDSRNMGAIPTSTGNLSFFSTRRTPILDTAELVHNPAETFAYDPLKTYVAFIIGDGDNVSYIMSSRKDWLQQRLADCAKTNNACAPLTWSISPHINHLAPDVLQWYFRTSHKTGRDFFSLPPSGHFYSYPSALREEDQDAFVQATEEDARILGVHSVVHWEWYDGWRSTEEDFLPQYAAAGVIQGIFPVNVPYMFPMFTWWPADQFYRIVGRAEGTKGGVVVFRPFEWRGVDDSDPDFYPSPQHMAERLASYPPGTVTGVYMTSDGGLTLENSFMALEKILPANIQIVSADTAARLALEAGN